MFAASAAYAAVSVDTSGARPADASIQIGASVDSRSDSAAVGQNMDAYLGIVTPGGVLYTFTASSLEPPVLAPYVSSLGDSQTWHKLLSFQYVHGLDTGLVNLLTVPTAGLEQGVYTAYFAIATREPFAVQAYDCKKFYVGDSPLGNAVGTFSGTWTNQTYGSSGGASFVVTQDTSGGFSIKTNLTGNVFGSPAPGEFTINGNTSTDAQGNIVLNSATPIGYLSGSIGADGKLQGSLSVNSQGINSLDFSGTVQGPSLNFNYTVNFVGGSTASGVVTGTNTTANSCL
ncbi:MAG: hypothetical protein A3H32_08465 [Betaproteobacteria bacterium RIFCSPLOWO2_02_FULL_63_19]|nr:MAG: hypothetical protein A3H32_08465 [Betaproteobacteria bacterium RIFCSPLOWO2_02_FULL_63_19]